jgi:GH35 family endo-1,4-beta-xylanase
MINPETTLRSAAEPHNIKIGTAVATNLLSNETYAKILSTEFNLLEPENDLKFGPVHPEPDRYNFAYVDKQVAFAKAHNMSVRGHTLVWHSQYAPWLKQNNYTPKQLNKILKDHIFTVMRRLCKRRLRLHRSGIPMGPRSRPNRSPLLQRLQHRIPRPQIKPTLQNGQTAIK